MSACFVCNFGAHYENSLLHFLIIVPHSLLPFFRSSKHYDACVSWFSSCSLKIWVGMWVKIYYLHNNVPVDITRLHLFIHLCLAFRCSYKCSFAFNSFFPSHRACNKPIDCCLQDHTPHWLLNWRRQMYHQLIKLWNIQGGFPLSE